MKKYIKVVIRQRHTKLGNPGEIIEVNSNYAFNYLIPHNIVNLATKGTIKHTQMLKEIIDKKAKENIRKAKNLQNSLQVIAKINIKKKIGDKLQIFGSVNEKEIIQEILKHTGEKIEKQQLEICEIQQVGIYRININLFNRLTANLKLQVLPINI